MRAFVDTSALYAVLAEDDLHHDEAARSFAWLLEHGALVTHNYVHVEAEVLVRRRLGAAAAATLIDRLLPALTTIWVDEATHRAAIASRRAGGPASLVDHVSFVVMQRHGIETALAFDHDFEARGFARPVVPPTQQPHRLSEDRSTYAEDAGPRDLVSVAEIAARSGRSVNTIQTWRRRYRDFPEPVTRLAAGPVWTWPSVQRWILGDGSGRRARATAPSTRTSA